MTQIISCSPSSTSWTSEMFSKQLYRFWTVALLCSFSCQLFSILNLQIVASSFFSRTASITVISNPRLTRPIFIQSFPNFPATVNNWASVNGVAAPSKGRQGTQYLPWKYILLLLRRTLQFVTVTALKIYLNDKKIFAFQNILRTRGNYVI